MRAVMNEAQCEVQASERGVKVTQRHGKYFIFTKYHNPRVACVMIVAVLYNCCCFSAMLYFVYDCYSELLYFV